MSHPPGLRCAYCDVPYDIIGKMETFDDDVRYVLSMAGLDQELNLAPPPPTRDEERVRLNKASGDEDRARRYFAQLDKDRKEKIFQLYKYDFEMFGYSTKGYM